MFSRKNPGLDTRVSFLACLRWTREIDPLLPGWTKCERAFIFITGFFFWGGGGGERNLKKNTSLFTTVLRGGKILKMQVNLDMTHHCTTDFCI